MLQWYSCRLAYFSLEVFVQYPLYQFVRAFPLQQQKYVHINITISFIQNPAKPLGNSIALLRSVVVFMKGGWDGGGGRGVNVYMFV